MDLRESVHVTLANMMATKARSCLSMLGLVIGTAAIIIVVGIANGSRRAIIQSLAVGSTDVIFVWPSYDEETRKAGTLTLGDVGRLASLPDVESATPEILQTKEVRGPGGGHQLKGMGVDPGYLEAYRYRIVAGRDINPMDIRQRNPVCLLVKEAADKLFQGPNPVGRTVRIGGIIFESVGVVKKPKSTGGGMTLAKNADYFIPLSTLLNLEQKLPDIPSIRVRTRKGKTEPVLRAAKRLFDDDPKRKGLIKISDPKEAIEDLKKKNKSLMMQLMSTALVSLLVGGIGIMNVMLTSVAERTREIGLRKALGATSKDVLGQFLVESSVLSGLGGVLGSAIGLLVCVMLPVITHGRVPAEPMMLSVGISVGFSFTFGLFFGLFPASKASQLSPIEALRYE